MTIIRRATRTYTRTQPGRLCGQDLASYKEGIGTLEAVGDSLSPQTRDAFFNLLRTASLVELADKRASFSEDQARYAREDGLKAHGSLLGLIAEGVDPQALQLLPPSYRDMVEAAMPVQVEL